jgi:hypothetical protein
VCVFPGHAVTQAEASASGDYARRVVDVLQADRDAIQRPEWSPILPARSRGLGLPHRRKPHVIDERVEVALGGIEPGQACLEQLHRRERASGELF